MAISSALCSLQFTSTDQKLVIPWPITKYMLPYVFYFYNLKLLRIHYLLLVKFILVIQLQKSLRSYPWNQYNIVCINYTSTKNKEKLKVLIVVFFSVDWIWHVNCPSLRYTVYFIHLDTIIYFNMTANIAEWYHTT